MTPMENQSERPFTASPHHSATPSHLHLLEQLCATPGVSGLEEPIIRLVSEQMSRHTNNVQVDRIGNVAGTLTAAGDEAKTLMIAAHMDEIGFVVRHIRPDGFLRVYRVGYPLDRVLPSTPIAIHSDDGTPHFGLFAVKSHHVSTPEERTQVIPSEELFVDAGFHSEEEVTAAGIHVGSPITWWPNFHVNGDLVMSKTLDNRLCLFAILKVMENLATEKLPVNVVFLGTVQEEFSIKGSVVAAHHVKPDLAVAIDVTISMDTPDLEGKEMSTAGFGRGVAINSFGYHPTLPFVGTPANPKLVQQMVTSAQRHELPYVRTVSSRIMTDVSEVQYVGGGVPVVELGIPTRYTHSPIEMATLSDTQTAIDLLTNFVLDLPADIDLSRH